MPFGVKNAPAVFQSLMTELLKDCESFARPYIDNIVIYSGTWEEHKTHVRKVLTSLTKAGLTANPAKCKWGRIYMDFLGHRVGNVSMMIPEMRSEAILNYNKQVVKKGLRSFLGAVSFYRRYVRLLATDIATLSCDVQSGADESCVWMEGMGAAFQNICKSVSNTCMLATPLPEDVFTMSLVKREGEWRQQLSTSGRLGDQSDGIQPLSWRHWPW